MKTQQNLHPVPGIAHREESILNCNGEKACGDKNFLVVVCAKRACDRPTSVDTCRAHEEYQSAKALGSLIEAPYVSWNHILKQGLWCMPVCILEDNIHPKMILASKIPTAQEMCKQYAIHGRCGIDFNP